jgi:hypothetical protein
MLQFSHPREHLAAELNRLDLMLRRQVIRLRAARLLIDDEFRGMYIPDSYIDELLSQRPETADQSAQALSACIEQLRTENRAHAAADWPLARVAAAFGLEAYEEDLLLLAIASELDLRYEALYSYVQNDVTKKRPTAGLALQLLASSAEHSLELRARFEQAAVFRYGLLYLAADAHDRDPPLPAHYLRMDSRMVDFLLGGNAMDSRLAPFCRVIDPGRSVEGLVSGPAVLRRLRLLAERLADGPVVFLHGPDSAGREAAAEAICSHAGKSMLAVDLRGAIASGEFPGEVLRREALLRDSVLYVCHWDAPGAAGGSEAFGFGQPVFVCEFPEPTLAVRRAQWDRELTGSAAGLDTSALAGTFQLSGSQVENAVRQARWECGQEPVTQQVLQSAARAQSSHALRRLAQKIACVHDWNDLVLPQRSLRHLREIVRDMGCRERVYGAWGFERLAPPGKGVNILFCGPSGTGKTMSASIIAHALELDLYRIDLAGVVSKYIGETEKNLREVFQAARASNAILFFDEADALFGKRSEVKDAHDRYANIEVAYLLQQMEDSSGITILATNLSKNLDEAFARRMQYTVTFPFPDAAHRERIWQSMFPPQAPLEQDIAWSFLARQFELSGGNIRNAALRAAFLAAEAGTSVNMEHVVLAVERELQKLGRLPSKAEFQDFYELVRQKA